MKIAFVFPGQGTQYRGMGKDIYENYKEAREIFDLADKLLGFPLTQMCFEGSDEDLLDTVNQQPAIHTTEIALLRALESRGIKAHITAGFSLGEYAANVCASALDFKDTIKLVRQRGKFIRETIDAGRGKMAAIIGLSRNDIQEILNEAKKIAPVEASNFNCPGQIIISGFNEAVDRAVESAYKKGAKKINFLKVSAPFHTSIIRDAGLKMADALKGINIKPHSIPLITNVSGKVQKSDENPVDILDKHIWYPVLWEDTIKEMVNLDVEMIVEIGPSGSLTKFNRKTIEEMRADVKLAKIENSQDIENLIKILNS
ncbi:ACP S-malonyltransferase [Peptoniphilaceae bacterium SGI.131]